MSIVQHIKVLDSQLANIKIVAGSTIYTRDTGKHFIDISDTERVQISDVVYIDTDKERIALLAPLPDKLYITRDTNKVWIYSVKTDKWVCLNTDTTYTAGTGININGTTINNSGVRAVTAGASANQISVNTNGTSKTITINNVANATSASKATNDSAGQQINTTYIKGLSVSGKVITYTKGDGTTGTITTQDSNTWRGIQNVLTSDSTTESLSAAQGKVLKGLVDGKVDKATTLDGYGITDAKIADGVITLGANTINPLTSHQSLTAYAKTADMNTALAKKADKATTLAGYGITDAKISGGVITLGSNTITPLTSHQSLSNYYTKGKVDELITNLKAGLVNVVESLPTTGEKGILYLVKTGSESENVYTEYIYVNDAWEKLGTQKLDLSGYLTKTDAANTYLGKTAAAVSANKLNTNAGSATQPVYFSNGVPVATTYTLGKSVPSNAVFTDTNNKVTQSAVTDANYTNYRPLVWGASNSGTKDFTPSTVTDGVFTSKGLYVQPSSGLIHATTFEGNLTGTASNAAKVNNLTVLTAVPANAKFTDTIYTHPATHPATMITGLAKVATSGSYTDLSNKPTIPTTLPANGGTATNANNIAITTTNPSSSATYYLPFIDGVSGNRAGRGNDGIRYYTKEGTTEATGCSELGLGNPTAAGTAGNKVGSLYMYGSGKGYTELRTRNTSDTSYTTYLPNKNGTIALTADIPTSLPANGGNSTTVNGHTVNSDVPANAKFTDTVYTHPSSHPASMITGLATVATSGSYNDLTNKPTIPAAYSLPDATTSAKGGIKVGSNLTISSGTLSLTKANVTAALGYTPPTTNTTYNDMKAATASAAGVHGLVPAPAAGKQLSFLRGDGTWVVPTDTKYTHPSSHPASMITGLATVATSGSYADLSNKPTSLPANGGNASTATKATQDGDGNTISTTYLKLSGGSMTGTIRTVQDTKPAINFRASADSYGATLNYDTAGNEALAINLKNSTTSFMVNTGVNGETWTSNNKWSNQTPALQIKNNCVYINELISNNTSPAYTLNVNGTVNIKDVLTVGTVNSANVVKSLSISGRTITVTKGDGTTSTLTTQDTNTDTKVTNTLATTTKAYVTGTTGATTNTGTQVFDTGVYLDTTAGTLVAKTFKTSTGIEIY